MWVRSTMIALCFRKKNTFLTRKLKNDRWVIISTFLKFSFTGRVRPMISSVTLPCCCNRSISFRNDLGPVGIAWSKYEKLVQISVKL